MNFSDSEFAPLIEKSLISFTEYYRKKEFEKWLQIYREKMLSKGQYLGQLYDIGFDKPEAHVIAKGERLYYAFYAERWEGAVELRGLDSREYAVADYWTGRTLGPVSPSANRLSVSFQKFLLLEATPLDRT